MNEKSSVYVKTDSFGYIIAVNSTDFLVGLTGWVKIDEGMGDRYRHAHGNYFPKPIRTRGGAYRYKLADGVVTECSAEEITQQETARTADPVPTQLDILEAQVTYTAMMTDTLLEV